MNGYMVLRAALLCIGVFVAIPFYHDFYMSDAVRPPRAWPFIALIMSFVAALGLIGWKS